MRLGIDGRKIPEAALRGPIGSIEHAAELGFQGIFFRTAFEMSPTLDPGEMAAVRARADELGLYLETGLGKVNPYATAETPDLRRVGEGDILLGFRRVMEKCAAIDCRELWVATANYQARYSGRFRYDRFRTDVSWADQLAATEKFLHRLAPIARDLGIYLNIETHEEITSFEVVRLVEAVGPDIMGIVFDTANVLQRAEHPLRAATRVAPYVRQTHLKDALLELDEDGISFQLRACGTGVVDFRSLLPVLLDANPDLNLTIENAQSNPDRAAPPVHMRIDVFDPDWLAGHPDLDRDEKDAFMDMVNSYQSRIASGEIPGFEKYAKARFDFDEAIAAIRHSAGHIREILSGIRTTASDLPD